MIPSRYGSPEPTPAQKSVPQPVQLDPNDRDIAALRQLILGKLQNLSAPLHHQTHQKFRQQCSRIYRTDGDVRVPYEVS